MKTVLSQNDTLLLRKELYSYLLFLLYFELGLFFHCPGEGFLVKLQGWHYYKCTSDRAYTCKNLKTVISFCLFSSEVTNERISSIILPVAPSLHEYRIESRLFALISIGLPRLCRFSCLYLKPDIFSHSAFRIHPGRLTTTGTSHSSLKNS